MRLKRLAELNDLLKRMHDYPNLNKTPTFSLQELKKFYLLSIGKGETDFRGALESLESFEIIFKMRGSSIYQFNYQKYGETIKELKQMGVGKI